MAGLVADLLDDPLASHQVNHLVSLVVSHRALQDNHLINHLVSQVVYHPPIHLHSHLEYHQASLQVSRLVNPQASHRASLQFLRDSLLVSRQAYHLASLQVCLLRSHREVPQLRRRSHQGNHRVNLVASQLRSLRFLPVCQRATLLHRPVIL